jgi:hypothetical protein
MLSITEDLDVRKEELDKYLDLIEFLNTSELIENDSGEILAISNLLIKTTKGSVYLLLYNLIEATMREAVVSIHDGINDSGSSFDDLHEKLQLKILQRARRDNISFTNMLNGINGSISLNAHQATFSTKDLFSGNIDKDEIVSVASTYGFSHDTNFASTGHGRHLRKVKKNRNDLAHGNKMFSGIGGDASIEEIRSLSNEVISYIYEITDNIVDCVNEKSYLRVDVV